MTRTDDLANRLEALETRLARTRSLAMLAVVAVVGLLAAGAAQQDSHHETLVARRIELLDDEGRTRLVMGQDDMAGQRIMDSVGLMVFDAEGTERGGFATRTDGSVVLAMDAPSGVGSPMRDRLALMVSSQGTAEVRLLGNDTTIPVRLITDEKDGGGVEFLDYDLEQREYHVQRQGFHGTSTSTHSLDG